MIRYIYTRIQYKYLDNGQLAIDNCDGYWYNGPINDLKGDDSAKAAEQAQLAFQQSLQGLFQKQFDKQSQIEDFLNGILKPMIENPTGYSPAALAALRTGSRDTIANELDQAKAAVGNQSLATGTAGLPSGVQAQIGTRIATSGAVAQAQGQNNITLQDEQLKQTNFWNAINGVAGVGATLNPLGYAGAATGAANSVAGLSQAVTASQQSGLLSGIMGGVFGAGSALLGNPSLFKSGCYMAAAVYDGWDDFRTETVRTWVFNPSAGKVHKFLASVYNSVSKPGATIINKIPVLKVPVKMVFDRIFDEAIGVRS